MQQPPSPRSGSFVWFSLVSARRGGSTEAVATLDTAFDESREKLAYSVTRSPARLCSRDGKLCYYGRLEYDFLTFFYFCLASYSPCFLLIPACFSSSCSFLSAAVICHSLASSACSCVICILPHLGIPLVRLTIIVPENKQDFPTLRQAFSPGDVKRRPLPP